MSRAGIITVDGSLVGVVIQIDDDTGSPQSSAPTGLQQASLESYSEPRYRSDDAIGHSEGRSGGRSHEGSSPHEGGRATTGPVSVGKGEDPRGMESHIRSEAAKNNVDPDTAVRVAKSEGLRDFSGDRNTSFGAFQLHKHGGLGDEFQKQTGLDPANPANEKAGISWALQNVGRTGWGPYHGAARVGVGKWDGIGGNKPSGAASSTTAPAVTPTASKDLKGDDVKGFIVHHTGGRGTPEGVQNTLRQRGLGVEYIMDRDGNITQAGNRGAAQMMTGWGKGEGLNNRNTVGMEVIAKDNKDVTPAQIAAGKAFIDKNYPNTPVYGHGEVNPGHKEADEGMGIVNAVRGGRQNTQANKPVGPQSSADNPYKVATAVQDPKYTRDDINELIDERPANSITNNDTRKPGIDELDKTYDSPQQERFNRPYAYRPAKDPSETPSTGAEKKEPLPSHFYPPTPGDGGQWPKGWSIPSDYNQG